jgi:GDPmannose 4,6-dehydratase
VQAVKRIAAGSAEKLVLGNIDISRDWGWAPEYVEAMWLMLQKRNPEDYVIATGHTFSLRDFVAIAFEMRHLDWRDYVVQDDTQQRPFEILINKGDPSKAKQRLKWAASLKGKAVVHAMFGEQG